jgi:NAD(P)-dependent dehydrogenase (short-subunit alcohol dehydrogenase family)
MSQASFDYEDSTVLITGASSGIGRDLALRFAESDATILNASIEEIPKDKDADQPTHEKIEADGGTAVYIETDVRYHEQIEDAVTIAHEYGGIDIFVNNAGIHITGSIGEITPQQFDRIHETNVKGYFFGCQAASNDMIERGCEGVIVNVASISSTMAKPKQIVYESTKGAVRMITRSSALELADKGIRVNAVAPGRTVTEFGASDADEKARSARTGDMVKPIPLGRAAWPQDISEAILFLASDSAEYITGEMLYIDGGYQTF